MSELNSMSMAELKEQAKVLGVTHAPNISEEKLRERLAETLGENVQAPASVAKTSNKSKFIKININESDTDKQPVFVGLNGRSYVIKRGEDVVVPRAVAEILETACTKKYDAKTMEHRMVPRFPFSVKDM